MMRIAAAAILGVLAAGAGSQTPARPAAPAVIVVTGRVVAEDTGGPLRNARITISSEALGTPIVLTDGEGRFSLPPVAPGARLIASKTGYAMAEIVATADRILEIRLRRAAAISGRVVDEFGEPVVQAQVIAEVPRSASTSAAANASTDDQGNYRLSALAPGNYVVAVRTAGPPVSQTLSNGRTATVLPENKSYYPNTATADQAREFTVGSGTDLARIDFVTPSSMSGSQPFSVVRPMAFLLRGRDPAAGPPRPSTATIRGSVLDTSNRPLPFAQVLLASEERVEVMVTRLVRGNANGQFEVRDLPAASYKVVASKPGYFPVRGGDVNGLAQVLSGDSIPVAQGQTREGIEIRLMKWGSLAGVVRDEFDDPVQGASVRLLQIRYEAGRRRLVPATALFPTTDDLGRYRLYALPPGQYIVSAAPSGTSPSTSVPGYALSFFPGTTVASQAAFVTVDEGRDVANINIALSRTPTFRVSGRLLDSAGVGTTGGSVQLMPSQRSTSVTSIPGRARILPDGRFEFANVLPGTYLVQAYRGRSNGWTEGEFGTLTVAVANSDVADLVLQMARGSTISGRISFDATDPSSRPGRSGIELSPIPTDLDQTPQSNWATADIRDDWSFTIDGINGPRRLQLRRVPPGWALKVVRVNGIDITDRPVSFGRSEQSLSGVEVVLTNRVSRLAGVVKRGVASASNINVIAFSTDRNRWYSTSRFVRTAVTEAEGRFSIEGLPFGSYYVTALTQIPVDGDDAWQDPALLESLVGRASSLTVRDGETATIGLSLP